MLAYNGKNKILALKGKDTMNNKGLTVLISVTLAVVCALLIINLVGGDLGAKSEGISIVAQSEDVVAVYGQGKISLKPDVAYLTFGYENIDIDPKKAQDENAEHMRKIIKAIKDEGIKDEEIQTSQYNVNQEYDYNGGQKKIIGYKVTNIINVKISDVDKASDIINTAINAGGNEFYGISFDVLDRQKAYLDAIDIALERAKEKAQIFADKEGRNISRVLEINEGSAPAQTYRNAVQGQGNYIALSYARDSGQGVTAADGASISSGQVVITATVTVVYAMR